MGRARGGQLTPNGPRARDGRCDEPALDDWHETPLAFAIGIMRREFIPLSHRGPECLRTLASRLGQPELGRCRATFTVNDQWVLKVPLTVDGLDANLMEAEHDDPDVPLARCRLHPSPRWGLALLWMERVRPIVWRDDDPRYEPWMDWVDCAQVGLTADGRIVAYDL